MPLHSPALESLKHILFQWIGPKKQTQSEGTVGPFQPEGSTHAACHGETIREP